MSDVPPAAVIIGTAGHVDHGKSSLVRALTGVDPDRLAAEKERGLTIELGFARLASEGGPEIGIVDVPGHEDFIRNMLAGATGVDLILLTVAADEGPMPQTLEHLAIAGLLGIRNGVVALTKIDRVDGELVELAAGMARDELERAGLGADWPIVPVSSVSGQGLEILRDTLCRAAAGVEVRETGDLFRLPVDRTFTVRGAGTVVTGSVWSGTVERGDRVRLLPSGSSARVRAVQVHGEERTSAGPGMRCALSLAGLSLSASGRGETVVSADVWRVVRRFGARLSLLADAGSALGHADTIRLYHGTSETMARVLLESGDPLPPGSSAWAVLVCAEPVLVRARDRFVMRRVSPLHTIGGGIVADLEPHRRWRGATRNWAEITEGDRLRAADAAVLLTGGKGLDPGELPLRTGLPLAADFDSPGAESVGGRLFAPSIREQARAGILAYLGRAHADAPRSPGVSLESVRAALTAQFTPVLIDHELESLVRSSEVVRSGPEVRLSSHEVRLTAPETAALDRVLEIVSEAGLSPPAPARLAELTAVDRSLLNDVLRILVDSGRLIAVNPEIFLSVDAESRLRSGARGVLERGAPATPATFGRRFDLSRRDLIPLLEYLDRVGVTRRTADGRVPAESQST